MRKERVFCLLCIAFVWFSCLEAMKNEYLQSLDVTGQEFVKEVELMDAIEKCDAACVEKMLKQGANPYVELSIKHASGRKMSAFEILQIVDENYNNKKNKKNYSELSKEEIKHRQQELIKIKTCFLDILNKKLKQYIKKISESSVDSSKLDFKVRLISSCYTALTKYDEDLESWLKLYNNEQLFYKTLKEQEDKELEENARKVFNLNDFVIEDYFKN